MILILLSLLLIVFNMNQDVKRVVLRYIIGVKNQMRPPDNISLFFNLRIKSYYNISFCFPKYQIQYILFFTCILMVGPKSHYFCFPPTNQKVIIFVFHLPQPDKLLAGLKYIAKGLRVDQCAESGLCRPNRELNAIILRSTSNNFLRNMRG